MSSAPPRDCWTLMVHKARQRMDATQQQLVQARTRLQQLQASEARLSQLMMEYRQRQQATLADGQLMADSLNDRQFIAQLQRLLDQAVRATAAAARQVESQAAALVQARQELDKAEKLQAHAQAGERMRLEKVAQKRQDEWAMMRYLRQDA